MRLVAIGAYLWDILIIVRYLWNILTSLIIVKSNACDAYKMLWNYL